MATGVVSVATVPSNMAAAVLDSVRPRSPLGPGAPGAAVTPQSSVAVKVEQMVEVKTEVEEGGFHGTSRCGGHHTADSNVTTEGAEQDTLGI